MAYANIQDTIFTGSTGRELRRHPAEVREVQFWLVAGPGRDPFGIFICEPDMIAPQLGRPVKKIRDSLEVLIDVGFCHWDEQTQYVWVVEMAHHQFLSPLKATDYRCATAQKWYRGLLRNPFLGLWFDRYVDDFHLLKGTHAVERREWVDRDAPPPAPVPTPPPGASMPLNNELFVLDPNEGGNKGGVGGKEGGPLADPAAPLKGGDVDVQFDRLWAVYPKAVERKEARAIFGRLKPTVALVDKMLGAIESQRHGESWQMGYIPKLVNWLEKHRWEDRIDPAPRVSQRTAATLGAAQRFADRRRPNGDK